MKVILASTSPRRKELLEREGIDFIIDASSCDRQSLICHVNRGMAFSTYK